MLVDKINDRFIIKIGDFGLSRFTESGTYSASSKHIPIRWSSIESIEYGIFSSKSDVWSFG